MAIKFKELRKYISRVVRLSIYLRGDHYEDYHLISDIPEGKFDDLYLYGIGMVDVEFSMDVYAPPTESYTFNCKECFLGHALEIVLHTEDRGFERKNDNELYFGDLRNYLQIGRYFSVMIKGEWKTDYYVMRQDIPDRYDDMLVYGIGIEDNPNAQDIELINKFGIMDTYWTKSMTLVLEDCANKS